MINRQEWRTNAYPHGVSIICECSIPYSLASQFKLPAIIGYDVSGVVQALDEGLKSPQISQRVGFGSVNTRGRNTGRGEQDSGSPSPKFGRRS